MIPHYEKHCLELAIRKTNVSAVLTLRNELCKIYRDLVHMTLSAYPGGKATLNAIEEDLKSWVNGPKRESAILGVFLPQKTTNYLFFLQLRSIDNLVTDFGKKYHNKEMGYLTVYAFSQDEDASAEISRFHKALTKAATKAFACKRQLRISWISLVNKKVEELKKKKHHTPKITNDVIPLLDLLKEYRFRNTILRTKQAKDPTLENIVKSTGLSVNEVKPELDKGLKYKILTQEFNVLCAYCRTPLARVKTKSAISQMVQSRVACPKCKKPITTNSYEDCFTVNPKISDLLDGSKWMYQYVRLQLKKFIIGGKIFTEVKDGPNELDLIANVDGDLLLMELKDAKFSIGHAYSFVGKCSQYKPEIAIICSTEGVDSEVKDYLKKTEIAAYYVESLEDLTKDFASIFSTQNAKSMASLLGRISWSWLFTKALLTNFDESVPIPEDPYSLGWD
jgi:hypothetical protein